MLDVPVAIAMVSLVVGLGLGAFLVFVTLHQKIERLQAECHDRARQAAQARTGAPGRS